MATENQLHSLTERLKDYKHKYLRKEFSKLGEPDTRIMVNYFLSRVLGYKELEEIKAEYRTQRSEYADYVIQVQHKKHFVVEVKSIDIDINERHLHQSLRYAADDGIDWILLMNGREIQLYRVNFNKPLTTTLIYKLNFMDPDDFKHAAEQLWYLTKASIGHGELESFSKRSDALALEHLAKMLYSEEVVKQLRTVLRNETDIYFQLDDVAHALFELITQAVEIPPKLRKSKKPQKIVSK